ncbi:P-loop NTPase family protein [Paenibacillus bouchesdurhonensis]|uniref:hypothetical protein n=1 Tax=Paenibacillus bouchesdurhonensis TaxID=1870990 RepID=UPI001F30FE3C|nr:hypothetical protein [Paenibacillus bouchesdurhonensis]
MVPVRLILAVKDEQYIEPFLYYVRHSEFDRRFSVTAFSRQDAFVRHMGSSRLFVDLVLAENTFLEAWLGGGGALQVPWIRLDEGGEGNVQGKSLSKFQPLPLLLSAVLECARGGAGGRGSVEGKALVVGIYSAVGGCGKTTVAIHLMKQLAGEGCKAFYLNLETISSGILFQSRLLGEGQNEAQGLARLLYDLKAAGERDEPLKRELSTYVYRDSFLEGDTFGPLDNMNEMLEMDRKDTAGLIEFIANSGLYDAIIVDVDSYPNVRTSTVLERCDKLIWLLTDEWNSMRKNGLWMSHIERRDSSLFREMMGKTLFTVNRCMGELVHDMPRAGMTAKVTLPNIPSWSQGTGQGSPLHSPAFQKDMLKLCRSVYNGSHSIETGGRQGD